MGLGQEDKEHKKMFVYLKLFEIYSIKFAFQFWLRVCGICIS
jgi:hypothetical protein